MAQQLVEAWRQRLRKRFPQHPHLVDGQVAKLWELRSVKSVTPEDLASLEGELSSLAKGSRLPSVTSEPILSKVTRSAVSEPALSACKEPQRPASASDRSGVHSVRSESSLTSCIRYKARMPYPRSPLQKPLDLWDHLVRYDSNKYKNSELNRPAMKYHSKQSYKRDLDEQMEDLLWRKQVDINTRENDRQAMALETKRYQDDQEREREKHSQMRSRLVKDMLNSHQLKERQLERERNNAAQERKLMLDRESAQASRDALEGQRMTAILQKRRTEKLHEFQHDLEEREKVKKAEREEEINLAERYIADLDAREDRKQAEIGARWERIKAISDSVGASNKEIADAAERRDEERMIRDLEKAKKREDEKRRLKEELLIERNQDMRQSLDHQIMEKKQILLQEREEMKQVGIRMELDAQKSHQEAKAKLVSCFNARRNLDEAVVAQIRAHNNVHSEHHVRPELSQVESDYNRKLLEFMKGDGYADLPGEMVTGKPCLGKRDRKTVPSYVGSLSTQDGEESAI